MYSKFLEKLKRAEEFYSWSPDGQYDEFVARICKALREEAAREDVESEPHIVGLAMKVMKGEE